MEERELVDFFGVLDGPAIRRSEGFQGNKRKERERINRMDRVFGLQGACRSQLLTKYRYFVG
jgi:hypothetical protein